MKIMVFIALFLLILSTLIMFIASFIAKKIAFDREKNSSFECGFDPKSSSRLPFSLHFFLIAIIFLIFDVEITLFFPLIQTFYLVNMNNYIIFYMILILILLMGLYHEWNQGALNWNP